MWLFIIAFFIITTLVILKTSGWSYNWKKNCFEQNGVIIINIKPQNSNFYFNNQQIKQLFPFSTIHLKELNPGKYHIKITKKDHYDWEKTVEVKPQLSTFINNVQLWLKSQPQLLKSQHIQEWFNLAENHNIYLTKNNNYIELWLFNSQQEENSLLYRFINTQINPANINKNNFTLSKDKNYLSFKQADNYWLFDLNQQNKSHNLKTLLPNIQHKLISWSKNDDSVLYITDQNNSIYKFNINDNQVQYIYSLNENINDFLILENSLYYLNDNNNFIRVNLESLNTEEVISLPTNNYVIEKIDDKHLFIHNENSGYFIQIYNDKIYYKNLPTNHIIFSPSQQKLAYINPKQLELFTLENFQEQPEITNNYLLTRHSTPMTNLKWFKNNEYLFYQNDNSIKVIELDGRGNHRNLNILYNPNIDLKGFTLSPNNEHLYIAQNNGLYKLRIIK